jgi:UDP-N-acetyl-D-glucosamine dehydrogenase
MNTISESTYSINAKTGKQYEIPSSLNDSGGIDSFLALNKGKKVIVVQGLGFVGAVMALVCANALTEEYAVIGIDLPSPNAYWKIQSINEGVFPIFASDPKIDEFYQLTRVKQNFYATYDPYCFSKADIIIVDINLDVDKKSNFNKDLEGYEVNLSGFQKAIESIGNNCKEDVLIVVETTVPPGTCQKIVKPIIKKCLKDRNLVDNKFRMGHSYERVMPGPDYIDSIQNFYRVYSGIDTVSADATELFLRTIISTEKYPLTRLGNTNATEMAKVLENSYRAMNIAFMVEWSRFAEEAGVNIYEIVNAIRMRPTHKNLMLPGIGVGGYCLTKDPLLASWARMNLFDSQNTLGQSEQGVKINDKMPLYSFEFLSKEYNKSFIKRKVLLLGVSYRSNVGDTRNTPVEYLHDYLVQSGSEVEVTDPYVEYWEEKDLNISSDFISLLKKEWDIIIFSTSHDEYKNNQELIELILNQKNVFVFDTLGHLTEDQIKLISSKHIVRVVGRGDIL